MNKTAIKNFAIWARNKLIAEITYKAGLLGITGEGVKTALPQSGNGTEYYDIGTKEPYAITGAEIKQRQDLVAAIQAKQAGSDYKSAYEQVIHEAAYTWFNRLIAIRFMEVNDYLPSRIRVLSSVSGKNEPDIVTTPFEAELDYTDAEKAQIISWKNDEKLDEAFRYLFLKQCNELNEVLPALFEKVSDYTELLLTVSFTDKDGVVYHLVNDIPEKDFDVINPDEDGNITGQVEIIGWLYQYYNTEPKNKVFADLKKNIKISKENIPAATQLFTPDWIVRYMVENSLGRIYVDKRKNKGIFADGRAPEEMTWHEIEVDRIASEKYIAHDMMGWKYYLPEAEQTPEVRKQLDEIQAQYTNLSPEDLKCIDPCMGSGHILVYLFAVLMQIYESYGYTQRDAAKLIVQNNLYGLDIDERAAQLAYFSVMMKARQYDRRFFSRGIQPHIYAIQESNGIGKDLIEYFADGNAERKKAIDTIIAELHDAKEYGSILTVTPQDFPALYARFDEIEDDINIYRELVLNQLLPLVQCAETMAQKYHVVTTNPPYMGASGMGAKLSEYVKKNYPDSKSDLFAVFMQRADDFVIPHGYTSLITMESWMFLSSFEKLRAIVNNTKTIINMVHMPYLGKGGTCLGINFGTAAVIMMKGRIPKYAGQYEYTVYYECDENGVPFQFPAINERWKTAQQDNFSKIPGSPVAYWMAEKAFTCFDEQKVSDVAIPASGTSTGNNELYLRLWHEVCINKISVDATNGLCNHGRWFPCNKGGAYRKWSGGNEYVIDWENDGNRIKNEKSAFLRNVSKVFLPGITWSKLGSGKISFRYFGTGYICESIGCCLFEKAVDLFELLCFVNSNVAEYLLSIINPTLGRQPGYIGALPFIIEEDKKGKVERIAKDNIGLSKNDWDSFETSWDFQQHPLV